MALENLPEDLWKEILRHDDTTLRHVAPCLCRKVARVLRNCKSTVSLSVLLRDKPSIIEHVSEELFQLFWRNVPETMQHIMWNHFPITTTVTVEGFSIYHVNSVWRRYKLVPVHHAVRIMKEIVALPDTENRASCILKILSVEQLEALKKDALTEGESSVLWKLFSYQHHAWTFDLYLSAISVGINVAATMSDAIRPFLSLPSKWGQFFATAIANQHYHIAESVLQLLELNKHRYFENYDKDLISYSLQIVAETRQWNWLLKILYFRKLEIPDTVWRICLKHAETSLLRQLLALRPTLPCDLNALSLCMRSKSVEKVAWFLSESWKATKSLPNFDDELVVTTAIEVGDITILAWLQDHGYSVTEKHKELVKDQQLLDY